MQNDVNKIVLVFRLWKIDNKTKPKKTNEMANY